VLASLPVLEPLREFCGLPVPELLVGLAMAFAKPQHVVPEFEARVAATLLAPHFEPAVLNGVVHDARRLIAVQTIEMEMLAENVGS
jgi:hypothetical protein